MVGNIRTLTTWLIRPLAPQLRPWVLISPAIVGALEWIKHRADQDYCMYCAHRLNLDISTYVQTNAILPSDAMQSNIAAQVRFPR